MGAFVGDVSAEETAARLRAVTLEPLAEVAVTASASSSVTANSAATATEGDRR